MRLKQTWRWFGPNDPVTLQDVKQAGAQGIVTALHHVPHGDVWTQDDIRKRQAELKTGGFNWDVVESVTIHEDIKTRSGDYKKYIDQYKTSLRNIAACGIRTVTYNFMPVNDWTRTNLDYPMHDGSKALYFNWFDLAVFDIHILKRKGATADYPELVVKEAAKRHQAYTPQQLDHLMGIVMFGIPGEKKMTVQDMTARLARYTDIGHGTLRENLKYFLQEITPVAEETGINLAIHPDDPPFDILGLPRVVCDAEDLDFILSAVPTANNGLCFCTGSLGANPENDLPAMARKAGTRIHFVHLRNTKRDGYGNFYEADHLDGDTDMYAVMKEILAIQQQVKEPIPFRPDHGHQMMDDMTKTTNPGYSCIGRMRGLAELRGLELGIAQANGW